MGESLWGKFGLMLAIIGLMFVVINFFMVVLSSFLPDMANMLIITGFIASIGAIILGIVGIISDDLRENAIRAVIAGIIFFIVHILILVVREYFINL